MRVENANRTRVELITLVRINLRLAEMADLICGAYSNNLFPRCDSDTPLSSKAWSSLDFIEISQDLSIRTPWQDDSSGPFWLRRIVIRVSRPASVHPVRYAVNRRTSSFTAVCV